MVKDDNSLYYKYHLGLNSPKKLAELLYFEKFGINIDWEFPRTYNEKINWLAFNTDTNIWSTLSDKLIVRQYLKAMGLDNILSTVYCVWNNPNKIDFELLPDKFVLKCNHDAGSTVIIDNKNIENLNNIKEIFQKKITYPFGIETAEPHYLKIERVIIAEEYLENNSNLSDSIIDYKFICYNGDVDYCLVCYDKTNWKNKVSDIYNVHNWQYQENKMIYKSGTQHKKIPRPELLNEMLEIVKVLSNKFPQCRIDMYVSNGRIYFGEFTFTSGCGRINNYSSDFLLELGEKIILPKAVEKYKNI